MPRKKPPDKGTGAALLTAGMSKAEASKEIGITGLEVSSGKIYEEFLTQLEGEKGIKVFKEMSENDPTVGAILFAIEMLIRQVDWLVEPASEDKEDVERAEFLESCMWDMDIPFIEVISEILSMLIYGYSIHEEVYKVRKGLSFKEGAVSSKYDDGKIGWRRLPIRAQETIDRWEFSDNGEVLGVYQVAPPSYVEVYIPATKLVHFRTTAKKGNPEGKSILRTAYRPWYFKKNIEEIQAIGVERDLAGLPMALVPPEMLSESASSLQKNLLAQIKKIVRNVRIDSQAAIVFPNAYDVNGNKLYDFSLISSGGGKAFNTKEIMTYYDQRIATTVLGDFVLLGHEKVGSLALASSKTGMFATAIGAWMDSIAETLNRTAVPRLFALNGYSGEYPQIIHGDIESRDLTELGAFITAMANAGAMLFPDEELERYLRRQAGLPEQTSE